MQIYGRLYFLCSNLTLNNLSTHKFCDSIFVDSLAEAGVWLCMRVGVLNWWGRLSEDISDTPIAVRPCMADSPVSRVRQRLAFVNLSENQYLLMATAFENVEKSQTGATNVLCKQFEDSFENAILAADSGASQTALSLRQLCGNH